MNVAEDPLQTCRPAHPQDLPSFGLVCISSTDECRYRTLTRTRFLALSDPQQPQVLEELYRENLRRLLGALEFCRRHDIRLYRITSGLFPMSDEPTGERMLRGLGDELSAVAPLADRLGIRITNHPDQFVVLNSDSPQVAATSVKILRKHALAFDLMGLPRSPWSTLTIHGGKKDRAAQLVDAIERLPDNVHSRLSLENDERAYDAEQMLAICRQAKVPMVFDAHHHLVNQKLDSYDHPSVGYFARAAATTWPDPRWQLAHLSNGREFLTDPRHGQMIEQFPTAFLDVPWIDIEAGGKEAAILKLRESLRKASACPAGDSGASPRPSSPSGRGPSPGRRGS